MSPLFAALLLIAAPQASDPPPETVKVEGPVVVFVSPVGPVGDPIRQQHDRLRQELLKRSIKTVEVTPTLIRFGEEDNPRKRVRQVDFRRTPAFVGTVIFTESRDPQIKQGVEPDTDLLARIEAFLKAKPAE